MFDTGVPAMIAGPAAGPDVALVSLRHRHGRVDAAAELTRVRGAYDGPLLVEPFAERDLPGIVAHADGFVVGGAWMQDFRLLRAVARTGLPVVVQRAPAATLEEWLSAAEYCVAEGNRDIVLCETGTRTHLPHAAIDLALVREGGRRWPTLADVSGVPELGMAAISAGARGLILGEDADARLVADVRARAAMLAPLIRDEPADTIPGARAAIDLIDGALATLLERRAELAGRVQRLKPVGGYAGRDAAREREIVEAMAGRAPRLGADRLARIMNAVIEAGLDASEEHDLSPA
jgi:chorismate mutase